MKKFAIIALATFCGFNFIIAQTKGFTIVTVNNGVTAKNQRMFQEKVRQLFPQQLAALPYVKTGDVSITVKIIIDSPQVIMADDRGYTITEMNVDNNTSSPTQKYETHIFDISYKQKIMRVDLIDNKGIVIARQELGESPVFSAKYQRSYPQIGMSDDFASNGITPTSTLTLFKNNTPPSNFMFKTNLNEIITKFAATTHI